jgi:hypothetical protein
LVVVPEAVGQWTGEGIAGLGLGGEVTEEALTRLLDRKDPRSGEPLPRPARGRPPEVDGFQTTNVFVVRGKRRSNFAADVSRGTRGQDHRHSTVSTRRSPPLEVEAPCARGWTWSGCSPGWWQVKLSSGCPLASTPGRRRRSAPRRAG